MRDGGRIAAAIEVLHRIEAQRLPAKDALKEWGRNARFAGARDRAWVSGLVLDALRRKRSTAWAMGSDSPRAQIIGALGRIWGWDFGAIRTALEDDERHAPAPLTLEEIEGLLKPVDDAPAPVRGDYDDWLDAPLRRAFGEDAVAEALALAARAPIDLRVNLLKSTPEKVAKPLVSVQAEPIPELVAGYRVAVADAIDRGSAVETIPAYSKGWVEVQDAGSQIAAAVADVREGMQVLDLCAGGGGKTLALSAALANTGQVYAYDIDGRRLAPIFARLQRAGCRNVQVRDPRAQDPFEGLEDRMDVVFIDAPCSGTGTWRRRPDAKWRLSPGALIKRQEEQDQVLESAARFVRPGGCMIYVTCSVLMEENEDRLEAFLGKDDRFIVDDAADAAARSGALTEAGKAMVMANRTAFGGIRLTPRRSRTDGFFAARLVRKR